MQMFEYVMVLASIVIGLAIAQLLQGVTAIVQRPDRAKPYWVHLVWVAFAFVFTTSWWWWEFRFQHTQLWTFQLYLFVLGYAVLLYLLCALLFPSDFQDFKGFKDYFYARRGWFFGVNAACYCIDLIDTALKGPAYFASFGWEYPIQSVLNIVFSVAAIFIRNERFQGAFAVTALGYLIIATLRFLDTVQ